LHYPPGIILDPLNPNNFVLWVSEPLTMSHTRVKLADITALTLYNDEPTLSRRGQPIPQLICKGKPCNSYTPDVIRCVNLGGEGTNVDWKVRMFVTRLRRWKYPSWRYVKCDTDLPDSLRLGRVHVSCEGWSGPGDSYVLKGMQKTNKRKKLLIHLCDIHS
jgi:hypothetical protein